MTKCDIVASSFCDTPVSIVSSGYDELVFRRCDVILAFRKMSAFPNSNFNRVVKGGGEKKRV